MTVASVINQITQRITRGDTPNTSDVLLYSPIEVDSVGLTTNVNSYTRNLDYQIFGNEISWALSGAEPTPGQAYYITYKYNPPQFIKDFDTVAEELRTDYNTLLPNLDVSKSVARDLFINVPSRQFSDQYNAIRHIFLIQSLQNVSELSNDELDAYGVNFSRPRLAAFKASGTIKFYMNVARAYSVTIPLGTRVGTQPALTDNTQITFLTTQAVTISAGGMYVLVPIEADVAGATGNVGSGSISIQIDPVDVDGITNPIATTGGVDQETNENYAQRLITVFKSRNIASTNGIKEVILSRPEVIDAYVADVGNPVMIRDGGLGGKVDVYVQSEAGFTGLISDESYVYASVDYVLLNQPVISITQVLVNDVPIPSTDFSLILDTGVYAKSTRATDKLRILSGASPGDVIKVTYAYNQLFNDLQDLMDGDSYHVAGIDVLIRAAVETFIDITATIEIQNGYIFNDVKANIIDQLTNYVEAQNIGSRIVYGDVLNIVHDTAGVVDMLPISRLSRSTENTTSTIQLLGNEYPRAGTITIIQSFRSI
jgi:uncharacterized phage protein gp47/JayE